MKRTLSMSFAILLCINIAAWAIPLPPITGNVVLGDATYDVTARVLVPSNVTITGIPGKTIIKGRLPSGDLFNCRGSKNVKFKDLTLDGGGIYADNGADGITVENVVTRNSNQGDHKAAFTANNSRNIILRRNLYEFCNYVTWMGDCSDILVEYNETRECGYGFKVFGDGDNKNWVGRFNYAHDCGPGFMAMEWQGRCANWVWEMNLEENMRLGPTWDSNTHALVKSSPMAKSPKSGKVQYNVFLGKPPSGNIYFPMAHELGGGTKNELQPLHVDETLVKGNYVWGANVAYAVTDLDATCRIRLVDNFAGSVNNVWNKNGSQQLIFEGSNGANAPPPHKNLADGDRYATWAAYITWLRTAAGRGGGSAPVPPQPSVPSIAQPPAGTIMRPGVAYTASGTGSGLQWAVDRTEDGAPEIATGSGSSITFTVPVDSTAAQGIRITLSGSGGQDVENYVIQPADQTAVLLARIKELETQLAAALAKLAQWNSWYGTAPR